MLLKIAFFAYESIRRLRSASRLEADWNWVLVHLSGSFFRDWTLVEVEVEVASTSLRSELPLRPLTSLVA